MNSPRQSDRTPRRGSLLPALAAAVLAVGCCLALVLDRLWLAAAHGELQTAAEAAALAAAGRLAEDERINLDIEPQGLTDAAHFAALDAAFQNTVAGLPVVLNATPGTDVQFGQHVANSENGEVLFLQTEYLPTTVRVQAARTRRLGNPVARLFAGLTGEAAGNVSAAAEASLTNLIVGVRPFAGAPAPMLPLAIFERDPEDERKDTWVNQIEGGAGGDDWLYDYDSRQVRPGSDGLPEMKLHPIPSGGQPEEANRHMVDVGNQLDPARLAQQIEAGLTTIDLADFGGAFRLDGKPQPLESSAALDEQPLDALHHMIGQKRIALLYERYQPGGSHTGRVTPTRLVAVRIMAIEPSDDGPCLIVQPTVVATRTALSLAPEDDGDAEYFANAYVYKMFLSQ